MALTLQQTIDRLKELNKNGDYEIYFKGRGNGDFQIHIEEIKYKILMEDLK